MNKRIQKYLSEIEKTEKKISDLQQYLKGLHTALKQEENNEMIKSIRSMKLEGRELFALLNGIQDGSVVFQVSQEPDGKETGSFTYKKQSESEDNRDEKTEKTE